jgi:hypothetical protein
MKVGNSATWKLSPTNGQAVSYSFLATKKSRNQARIGMMRKKLSLTGDKKVRNE